MENNKKKYGRFYTKNDFWKLNKVMNKIELNHTIIDPFAGDGDLLNHFKKTNKVLGYDIDESKSWIINDSIKKIPKTNNGFIVTNPPYLSKSSATRKNIINNSFGEFDNLYKASLNQMILSGMPGIAIIPETFIHSRFDMSFIHDIFILIPNPFADTEIPVCIVYFDGSKKSEDVNLYINNNFKGKMLQLKKELQDQLVKKNNLNISFGNPMGDLTFISFDSTSPKNKIRFEKNNGNEMKTSSRLRNPVSIEKKVDEKFINRLNLKLAAIRKKYNILIPPFNGNTSTGERRRRMPFSMVKQIIRSVEWE